MRAGPFYCLVLIGRIIRFVVLALGVGGVLQFWH
jgi:membrane protein YqaA with SNARE-associated domain